MPDPRVIVKALIRLNFLENEFKLLGERSKRKVECLAAMDVLRGQIPPPVLAHHNRIRARGRNSTSPVRDWVCRTCFIAVPSGLRTHLVQQDDLHVCENCGSYSYIPDGSEDYPDDTQLLNAARVLALKAEKPVKAAKEGKVPKGKLVKKRITKGFARAGAKMKKAGKTTVTRKVLTRGKKAGR